MCWMVRYPMVILYLCESRSCCRRSGFHSCFVHCISVKSMYNISKEEGKMKKWWSAMHKKIDFVLIWLFIYCASVWLLANSTYFIANISLRLALVLFLPFLIATPKNAQRVNAILHVLFGFIR